MSVTPETGTRSRRSTILLYSMQKFKVDKLIYHVLHESNPLFYSTSIAPILYVLLLGLLNSHNHGLPEGWRNPVEGTQTQKTLGSLVEFVKCKLALLGISLEKILLAAHGFVLLTSMFDIKQ